MTLRICRSLTSVALKTPISFSFSLLVLSYSTRKQPKCTASVADYLVYKHQFAPETASKVSSVLTCVKNPEKSDSILFFLKASGFSKTHLENVVVKWPNVLSANLDRTIKPKIQIFQDLGFSPTETAELISMHPWILTRSAVNQLGPSLLVLRNVFDSSLDVSKVLKISVWFLNHDLEKSMIPSIALMKSLGINSSQLMRYVYSFPRFFLYKPERIKEFVKRVDEMGFNRNSKMFLHAIRTVSSMTIKNWELKLELFRSLGFSDVDILSVFQRKPQIFAVSQRKIKDVTKLLLATGKFDISFIVNHPELLCCSIENRLKPRLRVVEVLENKKLLPKKPSLTSLHKITDEKFFEKFVLPYSNEVGEIYIAREFS
ncbi:unnamed protein product [Ilex paraguariensis]|uniref:Uncharacterized protein n=1 Tax=Ilex paraguariensis TaxID=185542 RepID=A0ABC8SEI2_9AQUA